MSKRFIDTDIMPKSFRKLKPSLKLTWFYLWTNCDKAGVWEIDEDLFEFENGFEFDLAEFYKHLSQHIEFSSEIILLKEFIVTNYGALKENYNPHKPVFRSLDKYRLKLEPSLNQASIKLEEEEEEEYEEEKEEVKNKNEKPKKETIKFDSIKDDFNQLVENTEIPIIRSIPKKRKTAINNLLKENSNEDFIEAIEKSIASDFLTGKNGGTFKASFDWLTNPTNLNKVLEGNYDNTKSSKSNQPTVKTKNKSNRNRPA